MEDIGTKLYELIKAGFDKLSANDPLLKSIAERIRKGTASMEDVSQYAVRLGFRLSQAIRQNLSPEALPNGRMYYNIAEKILDPMLHESYDLVNLTAAQVQELVDAAAGIHIRPQQADFPAERVQKAISAAAEPDIDWEKVLRRMTVPAANITASFADDFMETNAAFRSKAGFMTYIVRKDHSGCCGWCARQAGKYEYSSTPRDVYRRHDNCTCTVTYHADGKRQQVWSKREWSDEQEQEYLKDLDEKKAEKRRRLKERNELSEKSKPKRLSKKEAAERQARVLDKSGEGGIIESENIQIGKSLGAKALNYTVIDPDTGEEFKFVEGSQIKNPTVFAGKDGVKPLKPEVKEGLSKRYGGDPENWQHAKGIGEIDYYGEVVKAEVHWFQEETAGKHRFKVKEWLFDED